MISEEKEPSEEAATRPTMCGGVISRASRSMVPSPMKTSKGLTQG